MPVAVNSLPCSYCGLPTHSSANDDNDTDAPNEHPVYCCLGCRIAHGIVQGDDPTIGNRRALTRLGMAIFFTMNVMVFTLVLWTWNVRELSDESTVRVFHEILRYACLLFATPVLILLGGPLVEASLDALQQRRFTTDVLLLIGVCAAFGYSITSLLLGLPDVYFEVACMILVAVTLGKWLEATAKLKATQALRSLRQLLPATVRRVDSHGETTIPLEQILPTDVVRVLAGERVPVDGLVDVGSGVVDEQVVTGESLPRSKRCGDAVFSGTLNLDGDLFVCASSSHDNGTIARLVRAVEAATNSKCRTVRMADSLAAWFVPLIVAASLFAFWLNYPGGMQQSLMASLSVVLIACPCALGIATPLALWVAINSAASNGVLFRNGDAVMGLANLRSMGFDKTGTVTRGEVCVSAELFEPNVDISSVRKLSGLLAASSNHVLARAVASYLATSEQSSDPTGGQFDLLHVRDTAGKGVSGVAIRRLNQQGLRADDLHCESNVMLGSLRLAEEAGFAISENLRQQVEDNSEQATVLFGWNRQVQGVFFVSEEIRPEAAETFDRLRQSGLQMLILTGDRSDRAIQIEAATGIPAIGELLPEDKVTELEKLPKPMGMVGDGINDAIALAVADVGIAMDCGADVSRDAADVCLMGSTLKNLPWAIGVAKAARQTVIRNLIWAVGYNVVGIGFAVTGNLSPIIAAIAMVGSSLFVLTSSLRLATYANKHLADRNGLAMPATSNVELAMAQDNASQDELPTLSGASR